MENIVPTVQKVNQDNPLTLPPDTADINQKNETLQSPNSKTVWLLLAVAIILVLGIAIGVWASYFAKKSSLTQDPELKEVTVRLGWVNQAQFAGMYMAQEKGFYKAAGLNVTLLPLDKDSDQVTELASGKVDVSVMEAHQMLVGIDKGLAVKAIAAIFQINPHVLAARADSNIKTPSDFPGKVIGFAGGVNGEGSALLKIFAKRFEGNEKVTFISLGFNTVDNFIEKKADIIDLYRIDQPYQAKKRGVPLNIIPLDAYGFSTYGDVLVVRDNQTAEEVETMKKFVKATLEGWDYALKNQDEAVAVSLQRAENDYKDEDYQRHILLESTPLIRGLGTELGRMEFVSWSTLYESMREAGALEHKHDVQKLFTNDYLP